MPRKRSLRLAVVAVLLGILLLPASSVLAGSREATERADESHVRIINPQLWAIVLFTQLKMSLTPISAVLPISPAPKPNPDPDPPPQPFGGGGGGGAGSSCPACGGGETGSGSDPDGG